MLFLGATFDGCLNKLLKSQLVLCVTMHSKILARKAGALSLIVFRQQCLVGHDLGRACLSKLVYHGTGSMYETTRANLTKCRREIQPKY